MAVGRTIAAGTALAVLLWEVGGLHAAPRTYEVRIDSDPDGAAVYVGNKDSEPIGRTPYRGRLAEGRHRIYVELDGFVDGVEVIRVKKTRKLQKFSTSLNRLEQGSIEVLIDKGLPQSRGARILIDGKSEGELPDTIAVEIGAHQVEIKKEGFKPFEEWVEVGPGETTRVVARLEPDGSRPLRGGGDGDEVADASGGGDDVDGEIEEGVDPDASAERKVPIVSVGVGFEVGGRSFEFEKPTRGNLRPYDAKGVPLMRAAAEVAPLAFIDNLYASGLTLSASYGRSTPLDSNAELNGMAVRVPTTWSELDLGLGYRFRFGDARHYVGARVGYGMHAYTFAYTEETDILRDQIADVNYKFLSFGLDARFALHDRVAVLVDGGLLKVSDIGQMLDNYDNTTIVAYGGAGGVALVLTRGIELRVMGRFDQFTLTFTPFDDPGSPAADGGVDRYFGGTLSAFYLY